MPGFDWLNSHDVFDVILDAVILIGIIVLGWEKAIKPSWDGLKLRVRKGEKREQLFSQADVLTKFAHQLPPNGGPTIWEQLEQNEKDHQEIFDCIKEINHKLDTFILERKPNGRRRYDPHD